MAFFCLNSQAQIQVPSGVAKPPLTVQVKSFYNKSLHDSEVTLKQVQSFQQYIAKLEGLIFWKPYFLKLIENT